jgi:hypothetical protein
MLHFDGTQDKYLRLSQGNPCHVVVIKFATSVHALTMKDFHCIATLGDKSNLPLQGVFIEAGIRPGLVDGLFGVV